MTAWGRLSRVTAPASLPVSLDEFKADRRVDHADEDARLTQALQAAVAMIDGPDGVGVCMLPQVWSLTLDAFPVGPVPLGLRPVTSVDVVEYLDADGASQTLDGADWRAALLTTKPLIEPVYNKTWPTTYPVRGAVTITFSAGWATAADVPADLKAAVMLIAGHNFEQREPVAIGAAVAPLPMSVEWMLNRWRAGAVG